MIPRIFGTNGAMARSSSETRQQVEATNELPRTIEIDSKLKELTSRLTAARAGELPPGAKERFAAIGDNSALKWLGAGLGFLGGGGLANAWLTGGIFFASPVGAPLWALGVVGAASITGGYALYRLLAQRQAGAKESLLNDAANSVIREDLERYRDQFIQVIDNIPTEDRRLLGNVDKQVAAFEIEKPIDQIPDVLDAKLGAVSLLLSKMRNPKVRLLLDGIRNIDNEKRLNDAEALLYAATGSYTINHRLLEGDELILAYMDGYVTLDDAVNAIHLGRSTPADPRDGSDRPLPDKSNFTNALDGIVDRLDLDTENDRAVSGYIKLRRLQEGSYFGSQFSPRRS